MTKEEGAIAMAIHNRGYHAEQERQRQLRQYQLQRVQDAQKVVNSKYVCGQNYHKVA